MKQWWPGSQDWDVATDTAAFAHHFLTWRTSQRAGTSLPLAIVSPEGLRGELMTWQLTPGGTSGEVGIWLHPAVSAVAILPLLSAHLDRYFFALGFARLEAPVASGNTEPLQLMSSLGFIHEGTLAKYREHEGHSTDHDMYALTDDTWLNRRQKLIDKYGWTLD